ncbi:MAG: PAS domain-containing protein [Planctomycetes bacterium]|nr:PAS domain-containing protein [Planctomycetota bacterium]
MTLPLVASLAYAVQRMVESLADSEQRAAMDRARNTALTLGRVIDDASELAQRIAATPELASPIVADCRLALRDLPTLTAYYSHATVSAVDGRVLCLSPQSSVGKGASLAGLPAFEAMRERKTVSISGPTESPFSGRQIVAVAAPRFDAQGAFLGGFAFALDLLRLQSTLERSTGAAGHSLVVVTSQGRVVAAGGDPARWVGRDLAGHPLVARALRGAPASFDAADLEGTERRWATQTIDGTGWIVMTGVERQAALALLSAVRAEAAALGAFGMLLAAGLGLWLSRRIAAPIVALGNSARAALAGEPVRPVAPSGPAEVAQVVALVNDALDTRLRAQAELAASEQRLRAFLDHLPEVIHVWTPDGGLVFANRRWHELFNPSGRLVRGLPVEELLPRQTRRRTREEIAEVAGSGRVLVREADLPRAGGLQPALITRFPIFGADGAVEMIGNVVIDISDRRRAERLAAEHVERMEVMSRQVLEAQEAERRAIARELHDEVGQALTAVSVSLQGLRARAPADFAVRIDEARHLVDRVIGQIRDTSLRLRPVMLDDLGLVPALRWLVDKVGEAAGLHIDLDVGPLGREPPAGVATALYRVVQEALTNVLRHARAREVKVALFGLDDRIRVTVEDDGVGFDPARLRERASRGEVSGLGGLAERLGLIGGDLEVLSTSGQGTRVIATIPFGRDPA